MANRVVLGELPGGGFGLRVSRPGYNVLDAGLRDDRLAFDSRWPSAMRLIKSGESISTDTPSGTRTITFGVTLPIEPMCFLAYQASGGYYIVDSLAQGPMLEIFRDRIVVSAIGRNVPFSYYVFAA